jgi:hypothetical protein
MALTQHLRAANGIPTLANGNEKTLFYSESTLQ